MSDEAVCRTAPATPGLSNTMLTRLSHFHSKLKDLSIGFSNILGSVQPEQPANKYKTTEHSVDRIIQSLSPINPVASSISGGVSAADQQQL